jgi:RimJ/RimL family protein N-acetyltransferase
MTSSIEPQTWEPEGPLAPPTPASPPSSKTLTGTHVTLTPLLESHTAALYPHLGGSQNAHLYQYIPEGPFQTPEAFADGIRKLISWDFFVPYAVLVKNEPVGIITYLNVNVPHRSIEIGHILYSEKLKRTTAATEAVSLLMREAVEELGFLRVEWKCNLRNKLSYRAAERFGFRYEVGFLEIGWISSVIEVLICSQGIFRKHMVIKGRIRDTAVRLFPFPLSFSLQVNQLREEIKQENWRRNKF